MFYSTLLLAATALTGLVSAQNYSTSGPLTIDPNGVSYDLRLAWCRAQQNSCPQICGGQAYPNNCDANTLNYTCTCTGGASPNISDYDQTLPSFVCGQWIANCVNAHNDDLAGTTACRSVICGSKNASSGLSSSSSASASATASSTGGAASSASASATGSSPASSGASSATASAAAAASSSAGAAVLNVVTNYGTGILATAMLAVFGLAL
ncbi:hypothetical protein LTR53_004442 [Teratosphaeriaceae sp. CCFEE 6253]|nr:hypothetical protein LTR53_004442 [Teratosphaeriaceae sp. CCFEE 6253]